jgi:hypothetical protein
MYVGKEIIHTIQESQNSELSKNSNQVDDFWEDLKEIDFSSLASWKINSSVIDQIKKNNWQITRYQLEEFIERFFLYFSESEYKVRSKDIRSHYSFFLSSLKMISAGQPDSICDVKTQAEQAQELAIKNKLKELEKIQKEEQVLEQKLEALKETHFERWLSSLSDSQKTELAPPNNFAELGTNTHKLILKSVFSETLC